MTKLELIDEINRLRAVIGDLNQKIDELEAMAVVSLSKPLDADTSRLLSSMNARIRQLEQQVAQNTTFGPVKNHD
jgi:cell division septum initiation protein DivIVA